MSNKIEYNGEVIATPGNGQTVTIPCKNKVMSGDVIVKIDGRTELDEFWDVFQTYGNRDDYNRAFFYWAEFCFKPKYDICPLWNTGAQETFAYSKIEDIKVTIDVSRNNGSPLNRTFHSCNNLHTIPKLIVKSTTTYTTPFTNCAALENITIEGTIGQNGFDVQYSTKLTKASITSIINALSITTSGLTVTLSATAVNNAFEGGSTGTEWLTLKATKSNWDISLV